MSDRDTGEMHRFSLSLVVVDVAHWGRGVARTRQTQPTRRPSAQAQRCSRVTIRRACHTVCLFVSDCLPVDCLFAFLAGGLPAAAAVAADGRESGINLSFDLLPREKISYSALQNMRYLFVCFLLQRVLPPASSVEPSVCR